MEKFFGMASTEEAQFALRRAGIFAATVAGMNAAAAAQGAGSTKSAIGTQRSIIVGSSLGMAGMAALGVSSYANKGGAPWPNSGVLVASGIETVLGLLGAAALAWGPSGQ